MTHSDSAYKLRPTLRTVEYFTLAFGTMVGVGWLVVIDDWLRRGGPLGAMLGFLLGVLLLLPIGYTYSQWVRRLRDAGSEIAYTSSVFSPAVSFLTGWMMTLAYLIVCPWEAVAIGRILSYVFPSLNSVEVYRLAGKPVFLPHLLLGFALTAWILWINYRGIHLSGRFQNWTTFGLLIVFAFLVLLGLSRRALQNFNPPFRAPGWKGAMESVLLVLQIVPYFMTGFESVPKCCEEARPGFPAAGFMRAIFLALFVGGFFYVAIVGVVSWIYPWSLLTSERFGTAVAFERVFHWPWLVHLILFGAVLSLLKIFNGNFLTASRLVFALGRKGLLPARLGRIHGQYRTPGPAVFFCALLTLLGALWGEAILIPVTEVGSLASAVGWLATCLAFVYGAARTGDPPSRKDLALAWTGAGVSLGLILIKFLPGIPGRFSRYEYMALGVWIALGLVFWLRAPGAHTNKTPF